MPVRCDEINGTLVTLELSCETNYAAAITEQVDYIDAVAPYYSSNLQVAVGGENMNTRVTGVTPEYQQVQTLEIASALSDISGTLTLLLGAIAAISLLVGGTGVMNTMLVSVLERTREISIRKALGVGELDIWGQFLIEASLLTFAGGITGVAAGWVVALVIDRTGFMTTVVTAD